MSCKHQAGESLDIYFQKLKRLSVDCNFQAVSTQVHKKEAMRDVYTGGLMSNNIRQRLLEDHTLTFQIALIKLVLLKLLRKMPKCITPMHLSLISAPHIAKLKAERNNRAQGLLKNTTRFLTLNRPSLTGRLLF